MALLSGPFLGLKYACDPMGGQRCSIRQSICDFPILELWLGVIDFDLRMSFEGLLGRSRAGSPLQ